MLEEQEVELKGKKHYHKTTFALDPSKSGLVQFRFKILFKNVVFKL